MNEELASQLEPLHTDAFGWAVHCCGGDPHRAEDVLQTAYVKVLQGLAMYEARSAIKTWWFGLIRLTALEELRRQRYRESLLGRLLATISPGEETASLSQCPRGAIEADERTRAVRAQLASLPGRQAEVLHLVFYQDLSVVEAAAVMKVSVGSARQHYDRAKARMRELITTSNELSCHE